VDDQQTIEIQRMTHEGEGIGYLSDGRIAFVPGGLPGETVEVEIDELKSSFARAKVLKILDEADARVEPDCPYFEDCGGCQFWHADYDAEVEWKLEAAYETIKRIGKVELPEPTLRQAPTDRRYRTRTTMHRRRTDEPGQSEKTWDVGFFRAKSNELVPIKDCLIASETVNKVRRLIEPALEDVGGVDIIIETASDESAVVTLLSEDIEREDVPPSLKEFAETLGELDEIRGIRITGGDRDLVLGDVTVDADQVIGAPVSEARFPSTLFRQANQKMNRVLIDIVQEMTQQSGAQSVIELFSGAGNLSFGLVDTIQQLDGYEINGAAVEAANGQASKLEEDFAFHEVDLNKSLDQKEIAALEDFDLLLMDPPRTGADDIAQELSNSPEAPDEIVYVSCDPACLGRDLKYLAEGGWECERIDLIDMFPRTGHVEIAAKLQR
jgi:23S rRNA (uracil1939-C5)-methyltransferase